MNELVWYASYGSNMDASRFACYLRGGAPSGALLAQPGCRDRRPPREDRPLIVAGGVYFAGESATWTGGVAYYDPLLPGTTPARSYLISFAQFADVAAQEMRRGPSPEFEAELDLATVVRDGRFEYGPGRYETLLHIADVDGFPVLTFTAPDAASAVAHTAPSAAYLYTLANGLRDSHGWDITEIAGYLSGLPGAAGTWNAERVAELLHESVTGKENQG